MGITHYRNKSIAQRVRQCVSGREGAMIKSITLSLILTPLLMSRAHAAAGKTHVEIPAVYDEIKVFENGREILAKTLGRNSKKQT